jgi:hypothetical protein
MIDKQKQLHDAIEGDCKKAAAMQSLLADPSFCRKLDNFFGDSKIDPMTFFLIIGSLLLGLLLFDSFLPSLSTPYMVLCWGVAFFVTMFLYNSYATLAVSLCLAGIFILIDYSTQPLLCLTGVMSIVLGALSIWRYLKWFDTKKGKQRHTSNPHSPSVQGDDGR